MKIPCLIAAVAVVAGCATAKTTYTPDGKQGHSITCSGAALSWATCETKAGSLCKERGYTVVSATQDGQPFVFGNANQVVAGTTYNRTMLIACK